MKIKKVLNNSAVIVQDQQEEKIVLGPGVGFQKRKNDFVDRTKITKEFVMNNPSEQKRFQDLLKTIPKEHITLSEEIITYAEARLNTELNEHIHIALTDHLSFAIERVSTGLAINNKLLDEIKGLYREEYKIGLWAIARVQEKLGVELPVDEAGFIALHLHTAKMKTPDMTGLINTTTVIRDMVDIIASELNLSFAPESISYQRLITHLRFALQRMEANEPFHDMEQDMYAIIKNKFTKAYQTAAIAAAFVQKTYGISLPDAELAYIALHIQRVAKDPVYLELLESTGFNIILPIIAMADIGQAGAAMAVYFKAKNKKIKKVAINALPVCLLGITEPVIFGVNLTLVRPFIGAAIGGAVGGGFIALMKVKAISLGLSAIPLISIIAQEDIVKYVTGFAIAFVTAFIATWLLGFKEDTEVEALAVNR